MGVHDCGYKQLFSFPAMVADLIRGFVREKWVDDLDFDTLERKNGSYVSDDLREREDDIIWRVKWKDEERWMFVYFLIEFLCGAPHKNSYAELSVMWSWIHNSSPSVCNYKWFIVKQGRLLRIN